MTSIRDLRFAGRLLRKNPGASLLAVFALGLGIGLTALMYSIVNGIVLQGLPFDEAERLMHIESDNLEHGQGSLEVTRNDFADFVTQQTSFESLAAFTMASVSLSDGAGFPQRQRAGLMTTDSFRVLRVEPYLGRDFVAEDAAPGATPVTILGYDLWRTRFGEDREIIGQTVRLDGKASTIIGVMPPDFLFPFHQELWIPLPIDVSEIERGEGHTLEVFGRLRDGTSAEEARADLGLIAARLAEAYPDSNEGRGVVVKPYKEEFVGQEIAGLLYAMLGAVSLVLLIACVNVASLLMARASTRSKELAIRTALGARRRQVVGGMLTEGLVLSFLGAILGLGIAYLGTGILVRSISWLPVPFWFRIAIDPQVVAFIAATAILAGLLSALLPALRSSRSDVNEVLKDGPRGSSGLRLGRVSRLLVTGEIAMACALLIATTLMVRSIRNLDSGSLGFATQDILTARLDLPAADYPEETDRITFFERLVEEVESLPEVTSVALLSNLPGGGMGQTFYAVEGEAYSTRSDFPRTSMGTVTPSFFTTYEIPLVKGRLFHDRDDRDGPAVVVVNQSFAAGVWGDGEPIGQRLRFGRNSEEPWREVVGVVPDAGVGILGYGSQAGLYAPQAQIGLPTMTLAIKTRAARDELAGALGAKVLHLDPHLPLYDVRTMEQALWQMSFAARLLSSLFSIFGVTALVLASVGIYGVMAFSVSQRTQELGVRMAFGARQGQVLGLVLRQGMTRVVAGLVLGVGLGYLLTRSLRILLFQVEPGDPISFASTSLMLVAVAAVACLIPAIRASRLDPMRVLRSSP